MLTITYSYLYHLLLFYLVGLFVCFSSPVKDAVMSAIKISSNKPDCRIVNCIQGLKSGGRGMLINHTTIIQHGENKLFMLILAPFMNKKSGFCLNFLKIVFVTFQCKFIIYSN